MSDDDGDADNDGIPDDQELQSDVSGAGGDRVLLDGKWVYQVQGPWGETLLVDDNREVLVTVQKDGDLYMEGSGETLTSMGNTIGWDRYHGSRGSDVSVVDDTSGITDYQTTEDGDGGVDGRESPDDDSSDAPDHDVLGDDHDRGDAVGGVDSDSHPRRLVRRNDRRQLRREVRGRRRSNDNHTGPSLFMLLPIQLTVSVFGPMIAMSVFYNVIHLSRPGSMAALAFLVAIITILILLIWVVTGKFYVFFRVRGCMSIGLALIMLAAPIAMTVWISTIYTFASL